VGGSTAGLAAGRQVVLANQGADELVVTTNGTFVFAGRVQAGLAYAITVKTQPEGQTCAVSNAEGVASANVSDVSVRCSDLPAARYTVGGTITGLPAGGKVVLQNRGGDDLAVTANGGFTFPSALASGAPYAVSVKSAPDAQTCAVSNGAGTIGQANVSAVQVTCAAGTAVSLPAGDWQMDMCLQLRPGAWGRTLWRITRQGDLAAAVDQGVVEYTDAQCTGVGIPKVSASSNLGSMVFDRTASTSSVTAFWGTWKQPSGLTSRTVWARKGPYLCILGDFVPSVLPTVADVESSADLSIAGKSCYTELKAAGVPTSAESRRGE
jgi:hypothetical protein